MLYKIKSFRVKLGITQEELALKSGVTRATCLLYTSDAADD